MLLDALQRLASIRSPGGTHLVPTELASFCDFGCRLAAAEQMLKLRLLLARPWTALDSELQQLAKAGPSRRSVRAAPMASHLSDSTLVGLAHIIPVSVRDRIHQVGEVAIIGACHHRIATAQPSMGLQLAACVLCHPEEEFGLHPAAAQPAISSHRLQQAVRAPGNPSRCRTDRPG